VSWLVSAVGNVQAELKSLLGIDSSLSARVTVLEKKQMATDQFVTDITNAIAAYQTAVATYQTNVQTALEAQTATITSLQAQIANGPSDAAAIEALVTQLGTDTAAVNTAAAALVPAPVVPAAPVTT
jgi:uncharacterized coiled-coil protein SlyX